MSIVCKLCLFLLSPLIFLSCHPDNENLNGVWRGKDKLNKYVELKIDGQFLTLLGEIDAVFGKSYIEKVNGKTRESIYSVDYSRDPIWLDIIVINVETGNEVYVMKAIIRFLDDKEMEIKSNFNDVRPERFDDGDMSNTMVFTKIE